jgi:hypothetical protein
VYNHLQITPDMRLTPGLLHLRRPGASFATTALCLQANWRF